MILLDTDIISLVQMEDSPDGLRVRARIAQLPHSEMVATTVITYEEQIHGWFGAISRARQPFNRTREIQVYARLVKHVEDYRKMKVVAYDDASANQFDRLRSLRIRVGTNDLRIAAIALSLDATLITRNLHDFAKVPNLRVEDWTKP